MQGDWAFCRNRKRRKKRRWTNGKIRLYNQGNPQEKRGDFHGGVIYFVPSAVLLLLAARSDFLYGRVANSLVLTGFLAGISIQMMTGFPGGIPDLVLASVFPVAAGWLLFRVHAFGAGDLKLLAAVGCINGSRVLFYCIVCSFVLAAGYGAVRLLRRRILAASVLELFCWIRETVRTGELTPYRGAEDPERRLHFCVAVLAGYLLQALIWR
jgi:prepilin peptidase CpaA